MKILILIFASYFFTFDLCNGRPLSAVKIIDSTDNGIAFEKGLKWEEVLSKAKTENKLIFVDVFASWCGPCKMMDRDVYSNHNIGIQANSKFISIKIQADSTGRDDAETRSWYADAARLIKECKITGYPTLLFFDSNGHLIDQDLGYRKVPEFMSLLREAEEFGRVPFHQLVSAYRQGIKDYTHMDKLALFVKKVLLNNLLADSIAKDYIGTYLNKVTRKELCTMEGLNFVNEFSKSVSTRDSVFALCYESPDAMDRVKNDKGWAKWLVESAIVREELINKYTKEGRPTFKDPNWKSAATAISGRYAKIDSRLMLLNFQIGYYRTVDGNWKKWSQYTNEKIKLYPAKANQGLAVYMQLNMAAWDAFLNCKDEEVLKDALYWSDLSIKLESKVEYLDTRANLLYKLGRVREAIDQEDSAIAMSENMARSNGKAKGPYIDEFLDTKGKMLNKQPTWPIN